jgi:hypothetical protein
MSFNSGSYARLRAVAYALIATLMLSYGFDAGAAGNFFGVGCGLVAFLYFGWKCADL